MTKRVLVTGATGLIGRQVLRPLLDNGYDVVALSRYASSDPQIETLQADMLDSESRQAAVKNAGATHLLHLAWHDAPQGRWTASENQDWSDATLQLVQEFGEAGGTRAVCAGSCAEYDWSYEVLTETTPLKPSSEYGTAKAHTGVTLSQTAIDFGVSLAWARVFFCYGPGEPRGRLLGDLIYGIATGQIVACTDGLQERDYLHTADIGRALAAVLDGDNMGPINIASGHTVRVKELVETTARLLDRPDLIEIGARARPDGDPPRLVADITLLAETGFVPQFDLESGLRDCVEFHEARVNSGFVES